MREASSLSRMPVGFEMAHQNGFADEKINTMSGASTLVFPARRPVTLNLTSSSVSTMDDTRGDTRYGHKEATCVVLGVLMVDERGLAARASGHELVDKCNFARPVILGSVLLDKKMAFNQVLADELRNKILKQVPTLPGNFCFLTKHGWPISKEQERLVPIDQIVTEQSAVVLRKQFEKTRVGVLADEKEHLGFIFVDLNSSLRQVRDAIEEQLKENHILKNEYKFLETMGFPVTRQQENVLTVADALLNSTFRIQTITTQLFYEPKSPVIKPIQSIHQRRHSPALQLQPTLSLPLTMPSIDGVDSYTPSPLSIKGDKQKKRATRIFFPGKRPQGSSSQGLVAKPILISYVRAEAAEHALNLKEELSTLGFSVYLDVHEIKSGADWQDALNYAVSHCEVFVPLITPMYGKTQWTNREVKLADVLNKFIIPVNFLDQWPPECLAIQFASTQYIAWKPLESEHMKGPDLDRNFDYRVWDIKFVKKVSTEIANRYKVMCSHSNISMSPSFRARPTSSIPPNSPRNKTVTMSGIVEEILDLKERYKKPVVISAHPKQLLFADNVKKMLEEAGYQVWCSTELIEHDYHDGDSLGGFPSVGLDRELSTIPEGESLENNLSLVRYSSVGSKKPLTRTDSEEKSVVEKRALARLSSQLSTTSMVADSLTPDKLNRLRKFQEKVDEAGVVIILASEAYFKSTTSRQQCFYCEHRKKIILVKYDQSSVPALFSMLMGNDMITNPDGAQFNCALKARVKRELDPSSSVTPKDATMEAKMQYLVSFMKKNLPVLESCVYVSGSSRLQNERSEKICSEIGKALAKVKNINVVTGGFFGAGDITAKAFQEALKTNPRSPTEDSPTNTGPIFHILPVKDTKDFTKKATQNEEGSFEPVSYGNTLFLGDSVKERESVVARLFDICIVIEGGPGSAHEVEEFIWNDHYVVPIISSGGAAGGDFGVPLKIFETPPGVQEKDWSILSDKEASPQSVADAVVKIIVDLKTAIAEHAIKQIQEKKEKVSTKANRKRSKRSRKLTRNTKDVKTLSLSKTSMDLPVKTISMEQTDKLVDDGEQSSCIGQGNNRWQKIVRFLRPSRLPADH